MTIIQGDCLTLLKTVQAGSVNLVLTDPPYCISKKTGFKHVKKGVKRFAVDMDFGYWDQKEINLNKLCPLLYATLKSGGTCIIFYDLWKVTPLAEAMKKAGFVQLRQIIWEKTNPVPLNSKVNYLSNAREIAVLGVKHGKPTFHSDYDSGMYRYPIPRSRQHPTQKPLSLIKDLIEKHSHPGDLVIDPFLGSGTTAEACIVTNRQFLGFERDPGYIKISKQRLNTIIESPPKMAKA